MNERSERFFPDISDERSSYSSPLGPIILDLRRKNVVTATVTAAASGHQISFFDSSDPWKSSENFGNEEPEAKSLTKLDDTCTCSQKSASTRRRMSWTGLRYGTRRASMGSTLQASPAQPKVGNCPPATPQDQAKNGRIDGTCSTCGKRLPTKDSEGYETSRRRRQISPWMGKMREQRLGPPKHAEELLRATPHLRIMSQSSTDMQGSKIPATKTLLNFFKQGLSPPKDDEDYKLDAADGLENSPTYSASMTRYKANQQAAAELSSLLWILAHEMSLEDYGAVESGVFTSVFALMHSHENAKRMAGLAALDALIDAPSADEEKKAIKFANTLSNGLRSANGDFEFLSAVSRALGHMATRTSNVDFVESEVTRSLEWLRTERSDRRLAASLALKEFAIHAPTAFYSKTSQTSLGMGGSNEFIDHIFHSIRDSQPIVRACAADALSHCLRILMDRQHKSLTGLLCQVHFALLDGFQQEAPKASWNAKNKVEAAQHGSLLVAATMISQTGNFMLPRFDEVCTHVISLRNHPKTLIRLEVIRLLPRLARRCPKIFARRYLDESVTFLIDCARTTPTQKSDIDLRPSSFVSIGLLVLAMVDDVTGKVIGGPSLPIVKIRENLEGNGPLHTIELSKQGIIHEQLDNIFGLMSRSLRRKKSSIHRNTSEMHKSVFHCAADLVEALVDLAIPYINSLVDDMFQAGLSNDLIHCLHAIAETLPSYQSMIEDRLLQEVSACLVGGSLSAKLICDPLAWDQGFDEVKTDDVGCGNLDSSREFATAFAMMNKSRNPQVVRDIVLSLETLGSFGDSMGRVTTSGEVVPLLPFVERVASQYLLHPSSEVRRSAALTCCLLLVPPRMITNKSIGSYSGKIIDDVLKRLLQLAVSDPTPVVRFCIVRALDSRYDSLLCQAHHLRTLFLLLHDEVVTTRAAGVLLLGRLAMLNPAPILPQMRKFLLNLIIELESSVDTGRGREEATRLLVVFLRAKAFQRLVHPVLPSIVNSLPLNGATPRLVSAALEALGELAKVSSSSLKPWVKDFVPKILETLQDQSSASKQRTSLRTLAQIAGSTGYVIQPYIDFPKLLTQASDILPGTKRAPWSLRREVIRTLGVLGALDPDRYYKVAPKARKGGAVGGAYFVAQETLEDSNATRASVEGILIPDATKITPKSADRDSSLPPKNRKLFTNSDDSDQKADTDYDQPAHLFMYEQYAMVAQPVSNLSPTRRMTPADEEFYPTVAIQALMRIFMDPSLAVQHGMVMQAIMFIFKSLGLRCVPFLQKVVPHIIVAIRTYGNLRESLLKQVATLSGIVREHLRPYVADIFDIVEQFWPSKHLGTIFSLVSHLVVGVPDEFKKFVPRLIRRILSSLDMIQVSDWTSASTQEGSINEIERVRLILGSIRSFRTVLSDHLHVLVPAVLKLSEALVPLVASEVDMPEAGVVESDISDLTVLSFRTVASLLECEGTGSPSRQVGPYWGDRGSACIRSGSLSARVVQPLIRTLDDKFMKSRTVGIAIIECLCVCANQLGSSTWMKLYHPRTRMIIEEWEKSVVAHTRISNDAQNLVHDEHQISGLRVYDDAIEILTHSPLQRSYNDPTSNLRTAMSHQQDSLVMIGIDQLQVSSLSVAHDPFGDGAENTLLSVGFHQVPTSIVSITQGNLQKAWDVSKCASRDDWDEWMRRIGIQMLREAPSPALRATVSLAHVYQPLARELFSAAFVCCWKELSEPFRANLVQALEAAFVADVSPEILQTLLNLAEFMEHDPDGGLPISIPNLADLALKCRAYAKALHYKERESSLGGNDCVESLISINRKLDLQEAALGVLKSATIAIEDSQNNASEPSNISSQFARDEGTHELLYGIVWSSKADRTSLATVGTLDLAENKELWLAKLGSWTEALEVYEGKLERNSRDIDAVLGCIRCSSAIGQWSRVLDLTEANWMAINGTGREYTGENHVYDRQMVSPRDQKKALTMCAKAAWRLRRWDDLEKYSNELLSHGKSASASAALDLGSGGGRERVVSRVSYEGAFYIAVLHVHRQEWELAAEAIDAARRAMDSRFTASMAESYNRAYSSMVSAQTLAEMEEIIEYRKIEKGSLDSANLHLANRPDHVTARKRLLSVWRKRLAGCRVDAEVYSSILAVRSLVLGPTDEVNDTLTLSELCRQAQRFKLAERVLLDPLAELNADLNGPVFGINTPPFLGLNERAQVLAEGAAASDTVWRLVTGESNVGVQKYNGVHNQWSQTLIRDTGGIEKLNVQHQLYFAYLKHLWLTDRREEAMERLSRLCNVVDLVSHCENVEDTSLQAACWLELGEWQINTNSVPGSHIAEPLQVQVLSAFKRATMLDGCGYKAWHAWAQVNFRIAQQLNQREDRNGGGSRRRGVSLSQTQRNHVTTAIEGYLNAISLGTKRWSASVQQDMLNFLSCLFGYGKHPEISAVVNDTIDSVAIEAWLGVLPQMLARIHIQEVSIRSILHRLLTRLGEKHPQALMYPLSVLMKSPVIDRKNAAESLMNTLKAHSSALVEEALMVSSELIRIAILWLETWLTDLDDASRLCFGEGNIAGMLDLMLPLHEQIEKGAETQRENDFISLYGQQLAEAHCHLKEYLILVGVDTNTGPADRFMAAAFDDSGRAIHQNEQAVTAMNKTWDIYYKVFRAINKQLPSLSKLELTRCSPALNRARGLELGVPGSYRVDGTYVKIEKFIPTVQVITSKQRPRKITLRGSDGQDYVFLLKGHEDLRQDERVMQLFGLVNALLERDRQTNRHDLRIQRYAISPLSHNCGLVGWVPHTDTLHSLIRDYRQSKSIPLNLENREMLQISRDYDMLTVMQKVEVFTDAIQRATGKGNDLYEILWLKSSNSEEWLERRTRYTRSLAVMSMVGYILGLGDRHPSNLMLDKLSGRILHIDFGDCFEVSMKRDRFPENVPFRLTRMLVEAMGVAKIEGSYRATCERTISVLRENRDSLVAMLEAFVYDPLISWRLVELDGTEETANPQSQGEKQLQNDRALPAGQPHTRRRSKSEVIGDHGNRSLSSIIINAPISEEDDDLQEEDSLSAHNFHIVPNPIQRKNLPTNSLRWPPDQGANMDAARARSLQMYSNIQTWVAERNQDARIASIVGDKANGSVVAAGSTARSRVGRSLLQREMMSMIEVEDGVTHEGALNQKALKVVRRVQDKLSGTDFPDVEETGQPLDVDDQVRRLIVEATSVENLCQLYIGWCAFW